MAELIGGLHCGGHHKDRVYWLIRNICDFKRRATACVNSQWSLLSDWLTCSGIVVMSDETSTTSKSIVFPGGEVRDLFESSFANVSNSVPPLDPQTDLLELIDDRHGRRSTLLTSQLALLIGMLIWVRIRPSRMLY